MSDIIRELEKEQLRSDLPKLEIGDTAKGSRILKASSSKCRAAASARLSPFAVSATV